LLTYAALGHGAKGINYFSYGSMEGEYRGFENSPPLLAEIKKLNAEIKTLEVPLSKAFPVSVETIGSPDDGVRVYTMCCGDDSELVIVRNLAYTTDRSENEFGKNPRFRGSTKELTVTLRKPAWLKHFVVVDPLDGGKVIPSHEEENFVVLALGSIETVRVALIQQHQVTR
jgi:hypothetical protein